MPAETFVGIWKFIARPNLCETPACVKPPPRYLSGVDSAVLLGGEEKSVSDNFVILDSEQNKKGMDSNKTVENKLKT